MGSDCGDWLRKQRKRSGSPPDGARGLSAAPKCLGSPFLSGWRDDAVFCCRREGEIKKFFKEQNGLLFALASSVAWGRSYTDLNRREEALVVAPFFCNEDGANPTTPYVGGWMTALTMRGGLSPLKSALRKIQINLKT